MTASEGAQIKKIVQETMRVLGDAYQPARGERLVYTYVEAAQLLGRSPRTVSRMIARAELHPVKVNGARMISAAELQRLTTPSSEIRRQARGARARKSIGDSRKAAAGISALLRRRR